MTGEIIKGYLRKVPWSLLAFLYLASLGWDYYGFTNDVGSPLLLKRTEVKAQIDDGRKLQERIKKAQEFAKTLESKRADLRNLGYQLDEMKGTVSDTIDMPSLIKTITTEASKVGLHVLGLHPTTSKTGEYYMEQAFDLTFSGAFVQLVVFLDRIAIMERILRIENMDLRRVGSATASYVELEGKVQLKAYRYVGSRADELAKKEGGGG